MFRRASGLRRSTTREFSIRPIAPAKRFSLSSVSTKAASSMDSRSKQCTFHHSSRSAKMLPRMAGPIKQGERKVSWASRADSSSTNVSPVTGRAPVQSDTIPEESSPGGKPYFPAEHRLVEESPQPLLSPEQRLLTDISRKNAKSAPAETSRGHDRISAQSPSLRHSLDVRLNKPEVMSAKTQPVTKPLEVTLEEDFHLDEKAPLRAIKNPSDEDLHPLGDEGGQEQTEPRGTTGRMDGDAWGESFPVEWICTDRLPFFRTRHLRNPWNKDREVKVSRDGTELEPGVGQQLIDEWQKLAGPSPNSAQGQASKTPAGRRKTLTTLPS